MATRGKANPLQTAALLKLAFRLARSEQVAGRRLVYEGILRDLGLSDDAVETYLNAHYDALLKLVRGKERGEP